MTTQTPDLNLQATGPTGPRTPEGKAISSQNALKHGLASRTLIIEGEDLEDYARKLDSMIDELHPEGELETMLVHDMVQAKWFKLRALRFIGIAFELQIPNLEKSAAPPDLSVLLRYQTHNDRLFFQALKQLQLLQKTRREFVSQCHALPHGRFPKIVVRAPKKPQPLEPEEQFGPEIDPPASNIFEVQVRRNR